MRLSRRLFLNRSVRVWSGLDALTQNIEAYLSRRATPLTLPLALRGTREAMAGLSAMTAGDEDAAREPMALAALLSGLSLANGGLGAAHGIAQSLGIYGVPHGLACAVALPWVMALNLGSDKDGRFRDLADTLCPADSYPGALRGAVARVWEMTSKLGVPRLAELGDRYPDLPPLDAEGITLLAGGAQGNSLSGNPVPMNDTQVAELLTTMRDADDPKAPLP
jgi:alcohol dehydrogenase class IV